MSRFAGKQFEAVITPTGAYTMLFLFIMFAILSYVIPDEKTMDKEMLGLRNFMLMAVVIQCFAPVHNWAMRINYYYIIFIPVLIPKILKHPRVKFRNIAEIANVVCIAFFAGYYLLTTYIGCQTGISSLNTYPYVPFWIS